MSHKTILVHIDQSKHVIERIRIAADIALAENAHLIGSATTGLSRFLYEGGASEPIYAGLQTHIDFLRERASQSLDEFEAQVSKMGVSSFEKRLIEDDAESGITLQARYADLVVIGQIDPDEPTPFVRSDFPEYVVMNAGRPVLIVPYAGHFPHTGKKVMVAWNASLEATRALTGAIPFLKRAQQVNVSVFSPGAEADVHGEEPGADIALYLARHDINVQVERHVADIDIGNALLSAAADLSSDLIVMGAYGHSRFREILLGGATRTVLLSMTVPVLMSH
ncbi:MAG: universal stress protein [Pseudomonadota bacterium]